MTGAELAEKNWKLQTEYNNLTKYHNAGFKGNGITVLNAESESSHRIMTSKAFKDYAPEAKLLEGAISIRTSGDKVLEATANIDSNRINLVDAIDRYNIKIITRSYSGNTPKATLNYYKELQKSRGIIFVNSAGNESHHNGIWSKDDTAITVSAINFRADGMIRLAYYGSIGEIDFANFMARGSGTSAAAPALAGIIALLLSRYGDFNQTECVEVLKSISKNLGEAKYYGHGVPILPLADKLEILEELRGDKVSDFKDVEGTRWSKPAIDLCVEKGLLVGFEDGTFKPSEPVTREQMAVILERLINL